MSTSSTSGLHTVAGDAIDRFLRHAEEEPSRTAVCLGARSVSYGDLLTRVRQFAARFSRWRAPCVLVALPQGADAYAAMLAAGLAGGYYAPVNVAAPIGKIAHVVAALKPDVLVCGADLTDVLNGIAPDIPAITPDCLNPGELFQGRGNRNALAYVIFTSGSTGVPKGVAIPRHGMDHYVAWVIGYLHLTADDRVSQHPNIAFDLSVMDIYGALCAGAALHPLVDESDRMLPTRFIERRQLTVWISVPSVVSVMMRGREMSAGRLASLRLLAFCGEPLLREHLAAIFAACPAARAVNMYGPTEATVSMTAIGLSAADYTRACRATVAIGDPIVDMGLHLVGGSHTEEGEIVITGPQLADGYWNDPARTAQSFRDVVIDGRVLRGYFTGDWAERVDGHVYFRERRDLQVKIRGFRLELDEVEAAIRACGWPIVCALKWRDRLVAVIESPAPIDDSQLRRALAGRIEAHGIPEIIRVLPALPRNANDKLDRARLVDRLDADASAP
jgi:D-alanine--poly(phosphoribitol) ligase subunit 1